MYAKVASFCSPYSEYDNSHAFRVFVRSTEDDAEKAAQAYIDSVKNLPNWAGYDWDIEGIELDMSFAS